MDKLGAGVLGAIVGGLALVGAIGIFSGWGLPTDGLVSTAGPTRSDYVDLLLTLVTIFLAAIGLAVTLGALVIGMIALITLPRIRSEAAKRAEDVAANKISEILEDGKMVHQALNDMAETGKLGDVVESALVRLQGGPEDLRDVDGQT